MSAALKDPAQKNNRDYVDIIIALGMAKEGFDWIWCEHALTVGYRSSLTEIVQIIGRATRDAKGKTAFRLALDTEGQQNQVKEFRITQLLGGKFENEASDPLSPVLTCVEANKDGTLVWAESPVDTNPWRRSRVVVKRPGDVFAHALPGERVKAGQVLAHVYSPDVRAAFEELLRVSDEVGQCLGQSARTLAESGSWSQVADVAGTSHLSADLKFGTVSATRRVNFFLASAASTDVPSVHWPCASGGPTGRPRNTGGISMCSS